MRSRLVLALALASLTVSPARAQEIQITGPLAGAPALPTMTSYLPCELRGDLLFGAHMGAAATKGHDVSGATGFGGAFRVRRSTSFAWELDGGLLRGIEDASERRWLLSPRAVLIAAKASIPEWELYAAVGPSLEHVTSDVTRRTFLGGELGLAIDHRVDPVFNRFVVELVLSERRSIDDPIGWSTAAMLRIGIGTTFGFRQTER